MSQDALISSRMGLKVRSHIAAIPVFMMLATSGCSPKDSASAHHRFPIGMYGVGTPEHLEKLKEHGFDSFQTYTGNPQELSTLAEKARQLGMQMVVYPDQLRNGPSSAVKNWPIEAWYLKDEPDVAGTSPTELSALSTNTRRWDPGRPQTFVIGEGAPAERYAGIADILMLDWYPVPHLALDSVADQIDLARRFLPPGKPLWMVIQAFDWRAYEQRDPSKPRIGRFPTHSEIRFMSYLAIVHGAHGLFYFTLSRPNAMTLFDDPELWQAVASVAAEIKTLQPILENGSKQPPPFPLAPGGPEAKSWRYHGRDYVVILNRKGDAYQKVPDELLKSRWRPLFEVHRDPRDLLKSINDDWYLNPRQVLVFESRLRLFFLKNSG